MGNINVNHKEIRRLSLKTPFQTRTKSSSRKNLSHSFSFMDENCKIEKLNVNSATEEDLMTLSGITRQLAQAMVEHRKAIGRFKKIEDIALVSGMGAAKLEEIRSEICVNRSVSHSRSSSVDSLRSYDSRTTLNKLVNVNSANVFELQCIHGVTQEMAAAIVHYRNKKGLFKTLDDLIRVRNIDKMKLGNIRQYLTINNADGDWEKMPNGLSNGYCNGNSMIKKNLNNSVKVGLNDGHNLTAINNIYELQSAYSQRPILEETFMYKRNGLNAIRFATWNLQNFTEEKALNYGVKDVVCLTILENRWSIVILQEITDTKALQVICDELNKPKLQRVDYKKGNSRNWSMCMLETNFGCLYDKSNMNINIELRSANEANYKNVETLVTTFIVNELMMTFANVHLPEDLSYDNANDIIKEAMVDESLFIVLGDLSNISAQTMEQRKELGGLQAIMPLGSNTSNTKMKFSDNILINGCVQKRLTGNWGLVKEGLTHLGIPNGWTWGGPVSAHCPLWVEIYINEPLFL